MKRAYIGLRAELPYRRQAFCDGLAACGYDVKIGAPTQFGPETLFVCWNRYGPTHEVATRVENAGGRVLVCENGYIGGRLDGGDYYAIALGGHNGSGTWRVGGPERWQAHGIELKPWRTDGGHILVAANRSFGRPDMIMPPVWPRDVKARIEKVTKREVRVRLHPGNNPPAVPLERDLEGCHAVVIWSSSVGVKALIAGIPVIAEAPRWIIHKAALGYCAVDVIEKPCRGPREPQFESLAWAQWRLPEIASGEPFRHLLA